MLFGLDGVEIGLIIVFLCLFGAILSGFPVAFAIGGAAIVSFGILAMLDSAGILIHEAVDTGSPAYRALLSEGVPPLDISQFRYPDLPRIAQPLFQGGWELALDRNISFIVNRINERVLAGASIETLLAVLMFVLMGITLERSRIANDLLTTMARVFGPLPGGLAVAVVVVGTFLAASTGIVGATVVTMGLLSLPTMLRNNYSPELATGVIAASGTLGQIIPPSIVIVLLGTLAGDIYSTAQEARAQAAGCGDALTYLGQVAVVSVGTLFQAALLPGIFLALLYGLYAFGYAVLNPSKAPPVMGDGATGDYITRGEKLTWFAGVPVALVAAFFIAGAAGLMGSQTIVVDAYSTQGQVASLRTNVSPQCQEAMIDLHGQRAWDRAVVEQQAIEESGVAQTSTRLTDEERAAERVRMTGAAAPIGTGIAIFFLGAALVLSFARGIAPADEPRPLAIGGLGIVLGLLADILFIGPTTSPGATVLILLAPGLLVLWSLREAAVRLARNDLVRVVFPPLVLIVAVLGSILGGITNPTPAAALGAGGAIMLAAFRKLKEDGRSGRIIIGSALAIIVMLLLGVNFDLRVGVGETNFAQWVAYLVAQACYLFAIFGLLYSCVVLWTGGVLTPVVRETAKVTSMVFTILIGSQLLNLVVISFGGEHYIQDFLRSFDSEMKVFLIVMLVLFVLGFVLDFLEIIYIVIPIVGPVIYGGTMDPKWVTIMIAVNLQTSFLTPPFGFALFYLRGVAPKEVTTGHIYRGVVPFVLIQILGLAILWFFPAIVTIVPDLFPN
ncbi:TRAP-type mannitol/chloroaromatic compound transport system, large permease component [Palleronia marisminoris]|uniref:Sialic acid TRAP transporter permease protein SiaT n=1 Tax=Palleronia marisminoris TaxID=315423 RepID=A0A1Y5TDN9_9RHOB|nr:TRAP transporter large permease subunit [Palleronia marisminoris]SFH22679.1 TRAP-type mannitol/chloroaromatic compound transport system, large permease component [Palleronia marisminoris]SLN57975.1 Sialic acid TRAP transporter permease protein SiaT [Palleronia marisminoris]